MSYSGSERRRRKYKPRENLPISTPEKPQYLYDYLQRTGNAELQQYTVPKLSELFASGLRQDDLRNAWMNCRAEMMGASAGKYQCQSHGQFGQPSELPTEGVVILQRPQTQGTSREPEDQVPESLEETEAVKKELDSVIWEDFESGQLGQFFINKVFFDEEYESSWEPAHLKDSVTKVVTFEELFPFEGLRKMLVVNDRWFGDQQELLGLFPSDVHITCVCPMKNPSTREIPPLPKKTVICPEHYGPDYVCLDAHQELVDVKCHCPKARSIDIIHPRKDNDLCCTFQILRYDDRLRFVLTSASLNRRSWERVAQFGWYHDFPCFSSWAEDSPTEPTDFYLMLKHLLGVLDCDLSTWLERVDFSKLSPQVRLIVNIPGVANLAVPDPNYYGAKKLRKETKDGRKILRTQHTEKFFQFKRFGQRGSDSLQQVFDGGKHPSKMTDVKLVYPSADVAASVLQKYTHTGHLRASLMSMMYEYRCRLMDEWKYLHNIDDTQVLPHANVSSEYTTVEDGNGESRWFGWLCTGSHGVSIGAWGGERKIFYARYELSLLMSPHRDNNGTLRAVDLSKIGKHFESLVPYKPVEIPFYPETRNIHDEVRHCVGQLRRIANKSYGYVEQQRPDIPLTMFEKFPRPTGQSRHNSAMLVAHVCRRDGFTELPPDGSVIEFFGIERKDMSCGDWKFRVGRVIGVFNSWEALCEAHGVDYVPVKEPDWSSVFSHFRNLTKEPSRKPTPEEAMKDLKIETEEEFESYWQNKWKSWWTMDPFHKIRLDSKSEVERQCPMEPMRLPPDMVWLEKHVRQTCEDNLPPLRGPYRISLLQAKVDALWKKQFVGLPSRAAKQGT